MNNYEDCKFFKSVETDYDITNGHSNYVDYCTRSSGKDKRIIGFIHCPKCNKGYMIERVSQKGFKWLSCSEWKAGCDAKYSRNENGELVEMIFNKN